MTARVDKRLDPRPSLHNPMVPMQGRATTSYGTGVAPGGPNFRAASRPP
jgi:hypothetical protein